MHPIKFEASCAEGEPMAAATTELIRILRRERAWVRLEQAVERVDRAERLDREFTAALDRWRAEPTR
jgi:hypothetical protein